MSLAKWKELPKSKTELGGKKKNSLMLQLQNDDWVKQ